MADWKIIVVVLAGLLLITVGLFTEAGMNIGGFGERISEALRRGIPLNLLPQGEDGNITVTGTIYLSELDLKTLPLETVRVGYEPGFQDSEILLSDTRLVTDSYTEIELSDYSGTFMINRSRAVLVGNAEETMINGVRFETVKKLIPVSMGSVVFKNIYVKEFRMNRLDLEDVAGSLNIQGKITVILGSEPLKLENFQGSLNVTDGMFEISGMAEKVSVSGKDYVATVS
jgi:hypothetical protein